MSMPRSSVHHLWLQHTVLGARDDARVASYQQALADAGLPPAKLLDYRDVVGREVELGELFGEGLFGEAQLIRIESPGRDFEVYKALLKHGYDEASRRGLPVMTPQKIATIVEQRGLLLCPSQFFLGFKRVLDELAATATLHRFQFTSDPADIATLFDKRRCHQVLHEAGIAVPGHLGDATVIKDYDQLRSTMKAARIHRVFIKLRYGSSAAGVVAYQVSGPRELAITTAQLTQDGDDAIALFSSRRLRRYEHGRDIRRLIDALCAHEVHVEAWFPKAAVKTGICDLRVVMIAGKPEHIVLRSSRSPLTNLHLLNQRGDAQAIRQRMSTQAWDSLMDTCTRVAALFPRTLHLGIDVAVHVDFRSHAVLEVNAFGDHLKNVTHGGLTTYEAEIKAFDQMLEQRG